LIPVKAATGIVRLSGGRQTGSSQMPTETIIVLSGVMAAFVFFAVVVVFSDMTWSKTPRRKDGESR